MSKLSSMKLQDLKLIAYEAFIRRATEVGMPFMLKGSYLTRQYFSNPQNRIPGDLDWLYLHPIGTLEEAHAIFDDWATKVTEHFIDDGVKFRSFRENPFWRGIEYAMDDDFPTVNSDLVCWVDGHEADGFSLDISYNHALECPPVPLHYQPLRGNEFIIPYTVPIALQVSWKIHQTLFRPRYKDLFDLIFLVQHPDFDAAALAIMLQALMNDGVNEERLHRFLGYEFEKLFEDSGQGRNQTIWESWRFKDDYMSANQRVSPALLTAIPDSFSEFRNMLGMVLQQNGISKALIDENKIPKPTQRRK
jgi:hypothetical protein